MLTATASRDGIGRKRNEGDHLVYALYIV